MRLKKTKPSNDNTVTQTLTIHTVYGVWQPFCLARLKLQLHTQKRIYTLKRRLMINEIYAINETKIISILNPKCLFHFRFLFFDCQLHTSRKKFWEHIGEYIKKLWDEQENSLTISDVTGKITEEIFSPDTLFFSLYANHNAYVHMYLSCGSTLDSSKDSICLGH